MIIDFDFRMINLIIISAQQLQMIEPSSLYLSLSLLRAKMNLSSAIQALDKKSKDAFAGLTNAFPEGRSQEDRLHYLIKQASCILLPVYIYMYLLYLFISSLRSHIIFLRFIIFYFSSLTFYPFSFIFIF